jgi:hypothetical protein
MKLIPSRANDNVTTVRCLYCNKKVTEGTQCQTSEEKENCPNGSVSSFYKQMKSILKP